MTVHCTSQADIDRHRSRVQRAKFLTLRCLAATVALGCMLLMRPGARSAQSATHAEPTLRLIAQNLWVAPNDSVRSIVKTTNVVPGIRLIVTLHRAVRTRSAFQASMQGDGLGQEVATLNPISLRTGTHRTTIRFSTGTTAGQVVTQPNVPITEPGVYPLVFNLVDDTGTSVTSMVTYIVRLQTSGASAQVPLRVATELRLTPQVHPPTTGQATATPTAKHEAQALSNGLADATRATHASIGFGVSPAFLNALANERDTKLLTDLGQLTRNVPLQRTTAVPIDLAQWLVTNGLADQASRLTRAGDAILTKHLHAPDGSVADLTMWGDHVTSKQITWLADRGAAAVLVNDSDLVSLDPSAFPRTLAAPFRLRLSNRREVRAMQLDTGLSNHFLNQDPVLGANQLIGDLAIIALDLPAMERAMVVAPPRKWKPNANFLRAYTTYLNAAQPHDTTPLIAATPLSDAVLSTPPAHEAGDLATSGDVLVRDLAKPAAVQPLARFAQTYVAAQEQVHSLATMKPGGTAHSMHLVRELNDRLDLAAQTGLPASVQMAHFRSVTNQVAETAGSIRLPERQTITLTSANASLPLTIRRSANGPTTIRLDIDGQNRLEFPGGTSQIVHLTEPTTRIELAVHADSPGDALIRLRASSPDGVIDIGSSTLVVRSTAASGVGMIITFGSLGFLLTWWARDIVRVRRRRHDAHVPPASLIDIDGE